MRQNILFGRLYFQLKPSRRHATGSGKLDATAARGAASPRPDFDAYSLTFTPTLKKRPTIPAWPQVGL
jgi:hypothetical protein